MLPEMTPAVSRAVDAAQVRAQCRQATAVEPADLLHGLLLEEEGRAAALLIRPGVDLALILQTLLVSELPATSDITQLPLNAVSQDAMLRATELAVELTAQHTVASEALLLALLQKDEGVRHLAESAGANVAEMRTE